QEPSKRPGTNHLKPTGTSFSRRPSFSTTRSIMLLLTTVLPTAACAGQRGRCESREWIATVRERLGFKRPAERVTTPWRSASASLATTTPHLSLSATTRAIAYRLEG